MADHRILDAMRRFMTRAEALAAYRAIFDAYAQRLADVTIITGKSTEGESAQAQVVVNKEDFLEWMDCLKAILDEMDGKTGSMTTHVSHMNRFTET